jgi:hypothetical protein
MAALGKSLAFDPTEIDELLEMSYGGQRTFSVLSLLYPGLDLTKEFHEDHIFLRTGFTAKRLADADIPEHQVRKYRAVGDCLLNLQLLGGVPNTEKAFFHASADRAPGSLRPLTWPITRKVIRIPVQ